jgi:HAD superfamily hydrolase (TIGR01509 family)
VRPFQAVLLDVDGTLVNSAEAHVHAWLDALSAHGIEVPPTLVRPLIGMGGDRLIEVLTGWPKESRRAHKLSSERSEIFRERWLPAVRPLVGARKLLLRLRAEAYQYAIATAAKDEELEPLLEIADIADLCPIRTSSSDVEESKPSPDILEAAFQKLYAERSRTVMIGDTPYDLQAARDAQLHFIGVTTGGWSHGMLSGAVAVFDGPSALADFF